MPARPPLHAIRTSEARERRKSADSSQAMEIDIQHKEVTDPPVVGINLDDDDTQFPPSPPSLDDDITQFKATIRYPAVATMHLEGHGYLPNALLGHSSHPAFRLGSAFDWPESFDAGSLLDYEINSTYVPRPTSSKPTQATAQAAPSSSTRSYSQAVGSASPSSAPAAAGKVVSSGGTSSTQQASGSTSSPSKTGTALPKLVSNATIEQARPHPHAYYSMVHQAWTVITPIGMDTQQGSRSPPVTGECMVLRGTGSRKTHHYVRIPHAIDPKCLLRPSQQHYTPAISSPHLYTDHTFGGLSSAPFPNPKDPADPCWSGPPTPSQHCWDVYVCSGCRNAFAVSRANVIPSVWGYSLCQSFVQARVAEEQQKNQPPGDGLVLQSALEYIWK